MKSLSSKCALTQEAVADEGRLFEIDYVREQPYTLELDYHCMVATLTTDNPCPASRSVRRASLRKMEKILRVASECGMRVVREIESES